MIVSGKDFTASLDNAVPAASYARHASDWAQLNLGLSSGATPVRDGEVWTLTLDGKSRIVTVGETQLDDSEVDTLEEIAEYFVLEFDEPETQGLSVERVLVGQIQMLKINLLYMCVSGPGLPNVFL